MRRPWMVFVFDRRNVAIGSCLGVVALAIAAGGGCKMCASPEDYAYATFGGSWQRSDRYHGRVGSAFAPAGGPVHAAPGALDGWPSGPPTEETLEPASVTPDAEEIEPPEGTPSEGDFTENAVQNPTGELADEGSFPVLAPANEVRQTSLQEAPALNDAKHKAEPNSEQANQLKLEPVTIEPPLVQPPPTSPIRANEPPTANRQ